MIKNDYTRTNSEYSYDPLVANQVIETPPIWEKIFNIFKNAIQKVDLLVRDPIKLALKGIIIILLEPFSACKIMFNSLFFGRRKKFNYYGLNPAKITKEESYKQPTLLLHGGIHNQGAWLDLAKEIQQFNKINKQLSLGPVYTINFTSIKFCKHDIQIFNQKIEEIQEQYNQWGKKDVKVNLVGYCAGGIKASVLRLNQNCWHPNTHGHPELHAPLSNRHDIGKIIGICMSPIFTSNESVIYRIQGKNDILFPLHQSSVINFIVNSGHLGTFFSKATHKKIIEWLAQDNEGVCPNVIELGRIAPLKEF